MMYSIKYSMHRMKRISNQFKSPLHKLSCESPNKVKEGPEAVKKETLELKQKISELDEEIKKLNDSGYKTEELEVHIDKMHQYNDIKDVGQMVLGRIATLDGVRTSDLYEHYGLGLDD